MKYLFLCFLSCMIACKSRDKDLSGTWRLFQIAEMETNGVKVDTMMSNFIDLGLYKDIIVFEGSNFSRKIYGHSKLTDSASGTYSISPDKKTITFDSDGGKSSFILHHLSGDTMRFGDTLKNIFVYIRPEN